MGKFDDQHHHQQRSTVAGDIEAGGSCYVIAGGIGRAFSLRCVAVLLLSFAVFLSAIFSLPLFRPHQIGFVSDDADALAADIKAGFILEMTFPLLYSNIGRLEYDILGEIGVPNTKVSIISMCPSASINWTYVDFAVLPNPKNASISLPALSVLRSSLVGLALQQLNLSLTPSIFVQPSSVEVLKFPGGITVIPAQSASIWEIMQILFNFTLNNSVVEIQKNLEKLKCQLKVGLNLRAYENVYVQITNVNGSTVAPPVIVQASVLSDVGSRNLLPDRLKQLAQVIQGPHVENLGLNHSVFGKVNEVVLSSYLEHSIESPTPSPSPSPSLSLSPSPSPSPSPSEGTPYFPPSSYLTISYAPVPSADRPQLPCLHCGTFAARNPPSYSPEPESGPEPPQSSPPGSSPGDLALPPRHGPCLSSSLTPSSSFHHQTPPPASYALIPTISPQHEPLVPTSPMAPEVYAPSLPKNRRSANYPTPQILVSLDISPSPISGAASYFVGKRLIGLLIGVKHMAGQLKPTPIILSLLYRVKRVAHCTRLPLL